MWGSESVKMSPVWRPRSGLCPWPSALWYTTWNLWFIHIFQQQLQIAVWEWCLPMFFTVHWFISEPSVRVCPSVYITKQLLSSCSASHFIIHCFYLHLKIKSLTSRLKTSDLDRLVLGLEPYNSNYASWVAINYQPLCVLTRNWEMCWVTRLLTSSHWLFPLGAVNVSGTARVAWDLMSESRDFYLSNL